jgi:hypothetical protein
VRTPKWATRLVFVGVAGIALAAALEIVLSRRDTPRPLPAADTGGATTLAKVPTTTSGEPESLPRCEAQQLALGIKRPRLSSVAVVQLRHVRGRPCVVRMRINLRVFARDREPVALLSFDGSGRFLGEIESGAPLLAGFGFQPWCGQRGPFLAVVTVGPYKARRSLPHPRACETHIKRGARAERDACGRAAAGFRERRLTSRGRSERGKKRRRAEFGAERRVAVLVARG